MRDNRWTVIAAGAVIGGLSVGLVKLGNPANMGICVACFIRDIAGGLGLHRAEAVQYIRPEAPGFILGSMIVALATREFKARGGASPLLRFVMGFFLMIGALVFLGCPLRMVLRLAAGDLNALVGLLGFSAGILAGIAFLRRGFSLGRSGSATLANGAVMPVLSVGLLIAVATAPAFIYFSAKGPGSAHAPILASLAAGLIVGALAQRARLCMAGGIRDLFLIHDAHLFRGFVGIFVVALALNLLTGGFKLGFAGQPIAHTDGLWNFLGMSLVGLAAVLLGGCPLRQCVLAGEGDADAGVTLLGMLMGGAFAHNFGTAASAAGAPLNGKIGVVIGLAAMALIGCVSVPSKADARAKRAGAKRANREEGAADAA
ncbi:MAG: YedE family putative selenium transporter [Clostridia bacterium]|nr:YedE family putative selenium transporter [Clostridia bacterium]